MLTVMTTRIETLEQVRAFLKGTAQVDFKMPKLGREVWMTQTLVALGFPRLGRRGRGLVRRYLCRQTAGVWDNIHSPANPAIPCNAPKTCIVTVRIIPNLTASSSATEALNPTWCNADSLTAADLASTAGLRKSNAPAVGSIRSAGCASAMNVGPISTRPSWRWPAP